MSLKRDKGIKANGDHLKRSIWLDLQGGQRVTHRTLASEPRPNQFKFRIPYFGLHRKLAMANAIIWQTARLHQAQLFTQDADLKDVPDVQYRAKIAV